MILLWVIEKVAVMEEEDRDRLASLFKGVAHPSRVALLEGLAEGGRVSDVGEELGVTYGTLQDHLNILLREGLIYRPEESDQRYAVTELGDYFVQLFEEDGADLARVVQQVEEIEAAVREEFDAVSDLPLDETDLERAIQTETWERAKTEIESLNEN
jgi:DNA-binding transcriptional ArsR family regulator